MICNEFLELKKSGTSFKITHFSRDLKITFFMKFISRVISSICDVTFKKDIFFQVIAATNRVDILDPALLRSGRLDRKIEFPAPTEEARARIMQIHSRKMTISKDVNFDELARSTDDFNGAQCKAVCVEAGMIALRR